MNRRAGLAGLRRAQAAKAQREAVGAKVAQDYLQKVREQLTTFRAGLERFAREHKDEIRKDPELRFQFQQMCQKCGVDPLASKKGFWGELLGIGDFYYELAIKVITFCWLYKDRGGGLWSLKELTCAIDKLYKDTVIKQDDVEKAVSKLHVLGNGFRLIKIGRRKMIQSVPMELSGDHTALLELAETSGSCFSASAVATQLGWHPHRIERAIKLLKRDGLVWVDRDPSSSEDVYYVPSLFFQGKEMFS